MCINIETLLNKITFADCFNIMQQLPDKCIDIVFTDPPYGKKCDGGSYKFGVTPKKYNKESWDQKIPDKKVFDEIFRVSKNQIIFGGNYFTEYLPPTNSWFVWDKIGNTTVKNNFSQAELLWTSYSFAMQKITFIQQGFINDNLAENKYRFHPTQKPLKLIENILLRLIEKKLINKNSIIADFYSGSATIAAACYNLNLSFIAVENNAEYYKLSCKRLEDVRLQQKLDLWGA